VPLAATLTRDDLAEHAKRLAFIDRRNRVVILNWSSEAARRGEVEPLGIDVPGSGLI
jgi:hypothetical protein